MQPQNPPILAVHRVEFVDVLRGFALLGIFAAKLLCSARAGVEAELEEVSGQSHGKWFLHVFGFFR